jgi:uncharacterized delta-60 repeat protein
VNRISTATRLTSVLTVFCVLALLGSTEGTSTPWHAASWMDIPGTLDPTWGPPENPGFVTALSPDIGANGMAVQPDGKLVVVGSCNTQWFVARFTTSGALDATFAGGTGVTYLFGGSPDDRAHDVAIDGDGKIVVVGDRKTDVFRFTTVRLTPAGALDTTFGNGGIVQTLIGKASRSRDVEIQPNGEIVVGGTALNKTDCFALARYHPDGTLDTTFGEKVSRNSSERMGYLIDETDSKTVGAETNYFGGAMVLAPDGTILLAGFHLFTSDAVIVRYTTIGEPDPSFGDDSRVWIQFPGDLNWFMLRGLAVDATSTSYRIFLSGRGGFSLGAPEAESDAVLFAYDSTGAPSTGFGSGGFVRSNLPGADYGEHVTVQEDGNVVQAVNMGDGLAALRFLPDGSRDLSFDGDGLSVEAMPLEGSASAFRVALDSNGGLFVGGTHFATAGNVLGVAKFHAGPGQIPPEPPEAPSGLSATAVSSSQIDLAWIDKSVNEDGFKIECMPAGGVWAEVATVGANVTTFEHTSLPPDTTCYYRVRAYSAAGDSVYSNEDSATTLPGGGGGDDPAVADLPVAGTVTGTYLDTQSNNAVYESIQERETNDRLEKKRYSYLEHRWTLDVRGGSTVTFHVKAYQSVSVDGDNFVFAYSTDNVNFIDMVTVSKTADDGQYQICPLPSSLSGTVYIRVQDTDRTRGHRTLDTIHIDHMFIRSE